ncbi:MAG: D-alanyl-D-alanine carboxypeptidase [Haliscomenobacter sp.]|nr:D-alanyl-D-alanine carboxypeptidase [Haliscomenobacter sp.]
MNKKSWFFLLLMTYGSLSAAQHTGIQRAVQQFAADPALKHAGVGISVVDIQTNQTAASHQSNLSLIPASSLKVATTSTTMAVLGASYRFLTQLEIGGTIQERPFREMCTLPDLAIPPSVRPLCRAPCLWRP